jgi:hypothetical protein
MPEDGAIAEIELGQFSYRVFRPFAEKVKVEKTSGGKTATLMLEWREESGFLEAFEPNIVHEMVVLMLTGRWTPETEDALAKGCREKYRFLPSWRVSDFVGEMSFNRLRVSAERA